MNHHSILLLACLCLLAHGCLSTAQAQNSRAASASSYLERGNQWLAKGEYARAEADFTRYITLDSAPKRQLADAYGQRGIARLRQGRADEAQRDFSQCLTLNPNLRASLAQMIEVVKQQMAEKR